MSMPDKPYKKSFEVQPENTSLLVAEAFGIGPGWVNHIVNVYLPIQLPAITLITGESGCGKSTLLKMIGKPTSFIPPKKPLHAWAESDEKALQLLNSVGLNDASLFVLHYCQLSDSQQARARMYFWLCQEKKQLVVDEFLSTLDRKTARALAFSFQKMLRREGISLIAATAQDDLVEFLQPNLVIRGTAFPSDWIVEKYCQETVNPFIASVQIQQELEKGKPTIGGTCRQCGRGVDCQCGTNDYKQSSPGKLAYQRSRLGEIHYKGKYGGGFQEFFSAKLEGKIIGWLVGTLGRTKQYRISRVIVHPTYRGCGIGQRLVKAYLHLHPDCDTVAAMARFNPVFERAGMKRVSDVDIQPPTFLKEIPLTPAQWADKKECQHLMQNAAWLQLVANHAEALGRDTHPGGIKPKDMKTHFQSNPEAAAQALWRVRPRKMAKYVGPKHKLWGE